MTQIKINTFWIKQFKNTNQISAYLPSKIQGYSFLVGKMKLRDLLEVGTSTMLKEFYSFNSVDKIPINIHNIDQQLGENKIKWGLENFLKNYDTQLSYNEVIEEWKNTNEDEENREELNIIPQRLTENTRLSQIWDYLNNNNYPYFPNSFICAVNLKDSDIDEKHEYFEITLSWEKWTVFVIDGQHRLYGSIIKKTEAIKKWLIKEENISADDIIIKDYEEFILANKEMEVIVTLMVNIPIELQASLFQIINFRTQKIRSSLYFDLFNFPVDDISADELAHSIVLDLYLKDKSEKRSAWYLIHLSEFYKKEDRKLYISQGTLAKRITEYFDVWEIFYFYKNDSIKTRLFTANEVRDYYSNPQINYYNQIWKTFTNFMYNYFAAIKIEYGDKWANNDFQVVKSTWIGVFMNLLWVIYSVDFYKRVTPNVKNFTQYDSMWDFEITSIKNIIEWVSKEIPFDKEQMKASAWLWIQWKITTQMIKFLKNKWKLDMLLWKEVELKSVLSNEELRSISCKDTIFRAKLRRHLKTFQNSDYVPNEEYFAASILMVIGYIYFNLDKKN